MLSTVGAFFKRSSTKQSEDKEHFTPASAAAMAKQCLPFYLEPCKSLLLNDGEYPKNFTIDSFVKDVKRTYTMHMKQHVQHRGFPVSVTITGFQEVIYCDNVCNMYWYFIALLMS